MGAAVAQNEVGLQEPLRQHLPLTQAVPGKSIAQTDNLLVGAVVGVVVGNLVGAVVGVVVGT